MFYRGWGHRREKTGNGIQVELRLMVGRWAGGSCCCDSPGWWLGLRSTGPPGLGGWGGRVGRVSRCASPGWRLGLRSTGPPGLGGWWNVGWAVLSFRFPRLAAGATFWRPSGTGSERRRSCWVLALRVPRLAASGRFRKFVMEPRKAIAVARLERKRAVAVTALLAAEQADQAPKLCLTN